MACLPRIRHRSHHTTLLHSRHCQHLCHPRRHQYSRHRQETQSPRARVGLPMPHRKPLAQAFAVAHQQPSTARLATTAQRWMARHSNKRVDISSKSSRSSRNGKEQAPNAEAGLAVFGQAGETSSPTPARSSTATSDALTTDTNGATTTGVTSPPHVADETSMPNTGENVKKSQQNTATTPMLAVAAQLNASSSVDEDQNGARNRFCCCCQPVLKLCAESTGNIPTRNHTILSIVNYSWAPECRIPI